ncbi:MAG: hypothetical protein FWC11_04255, partial [Firmicutes bacterium]|nr:hypothetical protein [Bacillota bacterium]
FFLVSSTHSSHHNAMISASQSRRRGGAGFVISHDNSYLVISQTFDNELTANLMLLQNRGMKLHRPKSNELVFNENDIELFRFINQPTLLYTNISKMQSDFISHQISSQAVFFAIENLKTTIQSMFNELVVLDAPSHLKEFYVNLFGAFGDFENFAKTYSISSSLKYLKSNIAHEYLLIFLQES